ncbi:Ref family recombination enhancement nuclease [Vibrio alginolyticus]|uniref:Ref family recombination enhancement nuclease n=1 Tax=Vibrio TaxID=662 RepID=UPI001CDCD74D|nr:MULTISPECIES: Ref family recombination enhancement nuclease [Vibrio]MCA2451646.1 Ref family protein [Vibrio alginolyticus]MCA2475463.1 Ref family protein [Vibrio alginolyticus]MCS0286606.1 Ref family protein [Vibrio alginolyticus]MDW2155491.1 Ref family recombination enhancement nuclease [Vibrio sp. 2092]MDW2231649.1 Ref family recombination enhancement nuclease [Vibrio sp. 2091]
MKGRKPTKAEQIYGQAVIQRCGCIACDKLGHPNDWPEPLEYIEFHHSSEKGAVKPLAHFFGYGLCPVHHRGATGGNPIPEGEPVRHDPLGSRKQLFFNKVGTDLELVEYAWSKLPLEALDQIGELAGIWSFEELVREDTKKRNILENINSNI